MRLSGHEHNYDGVRCAEFGLGPGARREHIPKWICDRRATQPQAKFGATLRAAVVFRPDFVARSSQTPLKGMLVARASSGRKIPRRERHRSYVHDHLAQRFSFYFAFWITMLPPPMAC